MKNYPLPIPGAKMPYSKAAVAGGLVFLSGAGGFDRNSGKLAEGLEQQVVAGLENIKASLEEMGTNLENIVKIVYYTTENIRDWPKGAKGEIHVPGVEEWFRKNAPDLYENSRPGTLVQVTDLAPPGLLIEFDIIASMPGT